MGMRLLQTVDRTEGRTISPKIGPKFSGPWEIVRVTSPVSYIIVKDGYYPRRVHVQNIRLWHEIRDDQVGTEELDFDPDDPKNMGKSVISDSVPNVQLTGDDDDEGPADDQLTLNRVFHEQSSDQPQKRQRRDNNSVLNPNDPSSSGGVRTRSQRLRHPSEMDDYEIVQSVRRVSYGDKRYLHYHLLSSTPFLAAPIVATPTTSARAKTGCWGPGT